MTQRSKLAGYSLAVFLTSALVMVLEIAAGRLLAPHVGVSLYTWTSIIGVVLAGLSLGSWLGGRLADAGAGPRTAGWVIALAGVFALASLGILTWLVPFLRPHELTLVSFSFVLMSGLFFIPATLLGVVTPLLTTLTLAEDARAGHVVGRIHALGALGSILGTFITGYWLVQTVGTQAIVVGSGVALLIIATPFFLPRARLQWALMLALAAAATALSYSRDGLASPCDEESSYFCIRIMDASQEAPFGQARGMVLDHLIHGMNHEQEPSMYISAYVQGMDELVLAHFGAEREKSLRYFFVGGGAYTHPRGVKSLAPEAQITVAELDPIVTEVAERDMFLDTSGMRILHRDARMALQSLSNETFDVMLLDAFHDISIPYHLITQEFFVQAKASLSEDGLIVSNIIDHYPDGHLVQSLVKTMSTEFEHVSVWLEDGVSHPERVTYVVAATDGEGFADRLVAQRGFNRQWREVSPFLNRSVPLDDALVLTDNFVPVERLIARLLEE